MAMFYISLLMFLLQNEKYGTLSVQSVLKICLQKIVILH